MSRLEPDADLRRVLGEDQIDATDETMNDVLSGAYDDALEVGLESLMDADEDREDEEEIYDSEETIARTILAECQGVDEEGMPNSAFAITLDQVDLTTGAQSVLAQAAFCGPVLTVLPREEFIEFRLDFKTDVDKDLRVAWTHLERYGELCAQAKQSDNRAELTVVVVPFGALGTCFMTAMAPVMWSLQPSKPGEGCSQLKLLFRADDIDFYETDEVSLEEAYTEAKREVDSMNEAYAAALEAEEAKAAARARSNQILEDLRRNGMKGG